MSSLSLSEALFLNVTSFCAFWQNFVLVDKDAHQRDTTTLVTIYLALNPFMKIARLLTSVQCS